MHSFLSLYLSSLRNQSSETSLLELRLSDDSLGDELRDDHHRLLLHRMRELLGRLRGRFSRERLHSSVPSRQRRSQVSETFSDRAIEECVTSSLAVCGCCCRRALQLHLLHSVAAAATGGFLLQCPGLCSTALPAPAPAPVSCWPLLVHCSRATGPAAPASASVFSPAKAGSMGGASEASHSGSVCLWDSSGAGRLLNCIPAHRSPVQKMALNADTSLLATASSMATVVR